MQLGDNFDEDEKLLEDSHIGEAIMQCQALGLPREERRRHHRNLVNHLTVAEGSVQEAYIFMKTHLPPAVSASALSDFDNRGGILDNVCDAFDDALDVVKKFWGGIINSVSCWGFTCGDLTSVVVRLLLAISIYVEILKDGSLMVVLVKIEQNNIGGELFTFTRVLTIVMGLSILIPLAISSVETAWHSPFLVLGCEAWIR